MAFSVKWHSQISRISLETGHHILLHQGTLLRNQANVLHHVTPHGFDRKSNASVSVAASASTLSTPQPCNLLTCHRTCQGSSTVGLWDGEQLTQQHMSTRLPKSTAVELCQVLLRKQMGLILQLRQHARLPAYEYLEKTSQNSRVMLLQRHITNSTNSAYKLCRPANKIEYRTKQTVLLSSVDDSSASRTVKAQL